MIYKIKYNTLIIWWKNQIGKNIIKGVTVKELYWNLKHTSAVVWRFQQWNNYIYVISPFSYGTTDNIIQGRWSDISNKNLNHEDLVKVSRSLGDIFCSHGEDRPFISTLISLKNFNLNIKLKELIFYLAGFAKKIVLVLLTPITLFVKICGEVISYF